ncbi:MAG: hypothetical protein F6J97_09325 [Leptolyngbya sp. SIO4C1]|nr:hypothetical protein [Leptolyngbya sp. SIO4C1]
MAVQMHQGWQNHETWVVADCIDKNPDTYRYRNDLCDQAELMARRSDRAAESHLAELLQTWIETNNPLADQSGLYAELLKAALAAVDWHEVAEVFLSD